MRSLAPQGSTLQPATRLVSASVVPHSVVTTLQLSVSALAIAAVVFAAIVGWRYQSVRANQVWLDQCRAEYEWHHEVPQLERPIWQRTQKDVANAIGPACVSDFHTVKLAGELHDDSLSRVSRLKHVQKLTLESDLATDKTLQRLSHLRQLENLTLVGKQFSFEGLLELRKLPNLRSLVLKDMPLSMAELAVLETAVPQANLKYKRSQSSRTYERQVASRFPRLQKKAEPNLTGFAPST